MGKAVKDNYYKKKQTEHILSSLGFVYFKLASGQFWDFVVLSGGIPKLIKVLGSKEKVADMDSEKMIDKSPANVEREIWKFQEFKKMPDIKKVV